MKLARHLHRLGNDIVASYLIDTREGITLIDAGLPGHWQDLHSELETLGKTPSDIRGVILTHGDSDHIGFAERLRREHAVPVYMHAADVERATTGTKPKSPMGSFRIRPILKFTAYAIRKKGHRPEYLQEVLEVADGQQLSLPGGPVVIGMPGHSAGSIAVHVPLVDAIFVGDALTTRHVLTGRTGVQPAPFTDDPTAAAESVDRLAQFEASWILPGHGAPFHGSSEAAVADFQAQQGGI